MSRSLLVLPEDSARPILDAINSAKKSIRVKMFVFSYPDLLEALISARKRGVDVRVMLNAARRDGQDDNQESRKILENGDVQVLNSNPAFDVTHEKSMVVDDTTAFVKSLNWDEKNLTATRDFAVVTTHAHEVEEITACFEADWNRSDFDGGPGAHLIWCKGNGRDRIAQFIDHAKHSLWLQNERYQDPIIIERLVRANARGVKVHVMARPPHKLKREKLMESVGGMRIMDDVGIKIHKLKHLSLHAKMLLSDHDRAIVGSINLAPGSFDTRRELAIEVQDPHVIERLRGVVHQDWEDSHPMDLSDEGLIAEMERHHKEGVEDLALNVPHGAKHSK